MAGRIIFPDGTILPLDGDIYASGALHARALPGGDGFLLDASAGGGSESDTLGGYPAGYYRALSNKDFTGLGTVLVDAIEASGNITADVEVRAAAIGAYNDPLIDTYATVSFDGGVSGVSFGSGAGAADTRVGRLGAGIFGAQVGLIRAGELGASGQTASYFRDADNLNAGTVDLARGGTNVDNSSQAQNLVFASPDGSTGAVAFRALASGDIPNIPAAKITSGTLALARGGTNADNSSQAINLVWASPGSGGAGAASYRALVAADIPSLDAAKITSGALAAARQYANTAYLDAAAGQSFTNAQKFPAITRVGSQTAGAGLVVGDQTAVLDAGSLTSNLGITVYADVNGAVTAFSYVNRDTGSSAGLAMQYIFATSTGALKRGGTVRVDKNGAWTNATASTQNADLVAFLAKDGSNTEVLRVTSKGFLSGLAGDVAIGASGANATSATAGFLYVPTCAGTPTGVPTGFTGKVPLVFDTTNLKLYVYSGGAWKTTTVFA